jgi:hypothetical protein
MLEKIEKWYREAAMLHGDNWQNIETYVARKIAAASSADHTQLLEQMRALLGNTGEILH